MAAPFAGFLSPVGCRLVVQCKVCAELLETFDLGIAGRGCDGARAAHFRKLNGKQGYPAGALCQNGLAGFQAAELDDRAPGREPGAGERGGFDVAEVLRRSDQRVLRKYPIFGEDAFHRAAEGCAHLCFARFAADPAFEETADDAVAGREFPHARADPFDDARTVGHRHKRKFLTRTVTALDGEKIAIVQRCRPEPHQHLILTGCRHGLVDDGKSIDSARSL